MGAPVFSISLNNGMVKESGVAVAKDGPIFFGSLNVMTGIQYKRRNRSNSG